MTKYEDIATALKLSYIQKWMKNDNLKIRIEIKSITIQTKWSNLFFFEGIYQTLNLLLASIMPRKKSDNLKNFMAQIINVLYKEFLNEITSTKKIIMLRKLLTQFYFNIKLKILNLQ